MSVTGVRLLGFGQRRDRRDAYGSLGRLPAIHGRVDRTGGVWPRPSRNDRDEGGDGCEDQESGEQDSGKFHLRSTSGE